MIANFYVIFLCVSSSALMTSVYVTASGTEVNSANIEVFVTLLTTTGDFLNFGITGVGYSKRITTVSSLSKSYVIETY